MNKNLASAGRRHLIEMIDREIDKVAARIARRTRIGPRIELAPPITAFLARPEGAKAVAGWCGQPSRRFCTNLTSVEALLALSKSRIAAVWPQPGALRPWSHMKRRML